MSSLRILLVDDHTLVRAGIRSLLTQLPGMTVVAEADDGREALKLAALQTPDIALLDIAMPGLNGIEATVRLSKECPSVKVIILSMHGNEEYVRQAFQAGAKGYLLKKSAVAELGTALQEVQAGRTFVSRALSLRLTLQELSEGPPYPSPTDELTVRQREILTLIAQSRTTKEIALQLGVSAKTVEFHRAELMRRLAIFDVPGLVRYALKNRLAEPDV
jgi:DNA-binding NarL/FixJ family response regulator